MNAKHIDIAGVYRATTRRYLLAVLIIALLCTTAYYTLQSALSDSDATAYIVNLSGRQRMLSQHIALDAHRFHQAAHAESAFPDAQLALLQANITDMRRANAQLSSGVLSDTKTIVLSPQIRALYFGETNLHARVNHYLDIAQALLHTQDDQARHAYLSVIDQTSEPLLNDLNTAVQQYQKEGERRLASIEDLELLVWIATLITLVLEVLFIFRPMAGLIVTSQKALEQTMGSLETLVERRTQKLAIANKKLQEVATRDPLTQLKNRLTLEVDVENLIKASHQNHVPFALAVIDIDFFKQVNDSFGHPGGDYVLTTLSRLMKQMTREYDHLYRAGGEEFVLVLNRVQLSEAVAVLEKIRSAIEVHPLDYEGDPISVTISAGLCHSSQLGVISAKDVIRIADEALYIAKNNGRNRVQLANLGCGTANS